MGKQLHIVTHEVPWPPDFGGVIDLFYKIKALHQFGISIHLHCFTNKRPSNEILNKYCESVHYYPRRKNLTALSLKLPYIVQSRMSDELLANLSKDQFPIIFEGIHSSFYLPRLTSAHRKTFLRVHNVEHLYYQRLAQLEINLLKKIYYSLEARLLTRYEARIIKTTTSFTVSTLDESYLNTHLNAQAVHWLPVFLPWQEVVSEPGKGDYCLYHGNLAINENDKAARWLLQNVFARKQVKFVIAGYRPTEKLQLLCRDLPNVKLIMDPSDAELLELVSKAHINVLPSFNVTGVKLKFLNALFNGRHCIANDNTIEGSGLEECCEVANTSKEFSDAIDRIMPQVFSGEDVRKRQEQLSVSYDWQKNTKKLIAWIY